MSTGGGRGRGPHIRQTSRVAILGASLVVATAILVRQNLPERSGKCVGTVLRDGLKETEVNILSACDEEQKVESITDSQTPN